MAISAKKLVYDFHRKYHASVTGANNDLALVDIIAYLNEAQEIWYEDRVFKAQSHQKVRNDLRVFKKDKVNLTLTKTDNRCYFAKYPKDFYHRLNQLAITSKDCCPRTKEIIPRMIQSDDLHEARRNPYRKPDFFFEQLLSVETKDGILVYHDEEMDVLQVLIDYYRKPNQIHAPTHEKCAERYYMYDGRVITKDQDFEVDDTYSNNLVSDIAVLLASRDIGDRSGFETSLQKILSLERLGTGI